MRLRCQGLWTYLGVSFALMLPAGARAAAPRLKLWSPAFKNEGTIPQKYSCVGKDVAPPLAWSGVPAKADSLALVMDDPDAPSGTWTHWLVYDLPASLHGLPEGKKLPAAAEEGRNSFEVVGYGGPCPPVGSAHRYRIRLYALSKGFLLPPGAGEKDLFAAMKGRILAAAEMRAFFGRP
jgi:Raf kinase inhibitor-like YbhB/YbcL family protein